jgi:hypothetical protein
VAWVDLFCVIGEPGRDENASAPGTLPSESDANTKAAMNLFFIPKPFQLVSFAEVGTGSL